MNTGDRARRKTKPLRSATFHRLGNARVWDRFKAGEPVRAAGREILIHAPNHLGDTVMAASFASALLQGATGPVTIVTREEYLPVWRRTSADLCLVPYTGWCHSEVRRLRRQLAASHRGAVAFLLATGVEVAWLYRRAGVACRIGYDTWGRGFLLSHAFPCGGEPTHPALVAEHYLENLKRLVEATDLVLPESRADRPSLESRRSGTLGIVLGGNTPDKRFPDGFWRDVIAQASERHGFRETVLLGTDEHAPAAREIADGLPGVRDRCGRTGVAELATALEACEAVVSPDTGSAHLAARVGTPVLTLFTSGSPTWTRPLGAPVRTVRANTACAPCFNRTSCGHELRCVASIEVSEVLAQLAALLAEARSTAICSLASTRYPDPAHPEASHATP